MKQIDPTATRLRRVGLGGLPFDLAGPLVLAAFALYTVDQSMLVVAGIWAAGVLIPAVALRRAEIRISQSNISMASRLGPLGKWLGLDWQMPLAHLRVEVVENQGSLPRFRPWQASAFLHGEGAPRQINRILDWCRLSVPSDYLNRNSIAEALRNAEEPLPAFLRFPLLRALHERDVPIRVLGMEAAAEEATAEQESQAEQKPQSIFSRRWPGDQQAPRRSVDHSADLLRHPASLLLLVVMALAAIYAVADTLLMLDEGVANLEALVWLPLLGLALCGLFVAPVWASGLARPVAAGLLIVGWAVFSMASYPLLIRAVQQVGDEPRMVDYQVKPGPVLEPLEEGWPVIVRFGRDQAYWEDIPEDVPYALEMRQGPQGIFLVNVERVMASKRTFNSR